MLSPVVTVVRASRVFTVRLLMPVILLSLVTTMLVSLSRLPVASAKMATVLGVVGEGPITKLGPGGPDRVKLG